ncbi:MAG TPA: RNA polymerase sigma factor [Rhizomicrobium sp.]
MTEISQSSREGAPTHPEDSGRATHEIEAWFIREVLPLEADLMQFLRRSWQNKNDIDDLCQDVYARTFESARRKIPSPARPFVFTIARNLVIDRARREHVVPIEAVADLEALGVALDAPGPERSVIARDELRQLQAAIDRLPPKCREVVVLGRIEGLSGRQIAARLGIAETTVSDHLTAGMYALIDMLLGEQADGGKRS